MFNNDRSSPAVHTIFKIFSTQRLYSINAPSYIAVKIEKWHFSCSYMPLKLFSYPICLIKNTAKIIIQYAPTDGNCNSDV